MQVVDVSNPESPSIIIGCDTPEQARVVAFLGLTVGLEGNAVTLEERILDDVPRNASSLLSPEYVDPEDIEQVLGSMPGCASLQSMLCTRALVGVGG